jgi:hypothetical protein
MRFRLALPLILFVVLATAASAAPAGAGRHFIIAFPDTLRHIAPLAYFDQPAQLVLFAQQSTRVTVVGPGIDSAVTVDASHSTTVLLPTVPAIYLTPADVALRRTYELRADSDIVVYAFFATMYGAEAFTPLPVEQWDTQYFVAGSPPSNVNDINYAFSEEQVRPLFAPSQFAIIAATDGTQVTTSGAFSRSITLDAGEAYLVEPTGVVGSKVDPIGTRIVASAPIAVIAGGTRTAGPGGGQTVGRPATTNSYQNVTIDWLAPTSRHGTVFVYDPVMRNNGDVPGELIRLVATSPGTTVVRASIGRMKSIAQGDTFEIATATPMDPATVGPIVITTSRPAEAVLVTGHYVRSAPTGNYVDANTWATTLVEMTPRERWVTYSRFRTPDIRPGLEHWAIVAADSAARVWIDGQEVALRLLRSPLRTVAYGEMRLDSGDHQLRTSGGLAAAVIHGRARGSEAFKPPLANPGEKLPGYARREGGAPDDGRDQPMHPSTYSESMAYSYSYPIVGLEMSDSISVTSERSCDSTVYEVVHHSALWTGLSYQKAPGATNAVLQVTPRMKGTEIIGYRFRFAPIDRRIAATMTVIVRSAAADWPITYHYDPEFIDVSPTRVYFSNAPVGIAVTASASVRNRGDGEITVTGVRMLDGTRGFSVAANLPAILAPGEQLPIRITFTGAAKLSTYRDSVVVTTECGRGSGAVLADTRDVPSEPVPTIDTVDWRERWLSTLNACTKSGVAAYDSIVTIADLGDAPFTVASLELVGADADSGFFRLDRSDRTTSIEPGDIIAPATAGGGPYRQRVLFLPHDERAYACLVRLATTDADTVYGELRGVGIESHIVIDPDPLDAGTIGFAGVLTAVRCTATVHAPPTRALTVRELAITGVDASAFVFDNSGGFQAPRAGDSATWWVLTPGDQRDVPLLFIPSDTGSAVASLEATGDHSRCDDSTITLLGRSVPPIAVGEVRPIARSACGDTVVRVILVNRSTATVTLGRLDITPADEFGLAVPIAVPRAIAPGDTLVLAIRYAPVRIGIARARIDLDIVDVPGGRLLQNVRVSFTADARGDTLSAHVVPPARMAIGAMSIVRVLLDDPSTAIEPGALRLMAGWNPNVLRLLRVRTDGTLLEGWNATIDRLEDDTLEATFTPGANPVLARGGILAKLEFLPFLGPDTLSEVSATLVASARPCVETMVEPGVAHLDSICGLTNRLFELFPASALKLAAAPNPFARATTIAFSLAVPSHARLEILDALGRRVAVLVDDDLGAGDHTAAFDADVSGLYLVRLVAGEAVTSAPVWRVP